MIRETVDVVSSRAIKLEAENANLQAQLAAKEERIGALMQQNTELQNFLMEITRTALGQKDATGKADIPKVEEGHGEG